MNALNTDIAGLAVQLTAASQLAGLDNTGNPLGTTVDNLIKVRVKTPADLLAPGNKADENWSDFIPKEVVAASPLDKILLVVLQILGLDDADLEALEASKATTLKPSFESVNVGIFERVLQFIDPGEDNLTNKNSPPSTSSYRAGDPDLIDKFSRLIGLDDEPNNVHHENTPYAEEKESKLDKFLTKIEIFIDLSDDESVLDQILDKI